MRFRKALQQAFDEQSLELLTGDYFTPAQTLSQVAAPGSGTFEFRIFKLIEQARIEDWLADLVAAAAERRPRNAELQSLAEEVGLTLLGPRVDNATVQPLEAIVNKEAKLISFSEFVERLPRLQGQVCFVDVPDGGGTGFLVGKDLVLTNEHVVRPVVKGDIRAQDVRCRFDYREELGGRAVARKGVTEVALAAGWDVDHAPPSVFDWDPALGDPKPDEADYALVRLAEAVGELPVGGDAPDPQLEPRGWIELPAQPPKLAKGNQVFLVQHPCREPLQLAIGAVEAFNASGTRMRHSANSKDGSSGAPCLNADLQLVALHHAHDPAQPPKWNQAVPLDVIQSVWKARGVAVG